MKRGAELLRLTVYGQPKGAGSKTAEPLGKRFKEARDADGRLILKYRHATKGTAEWMEIVEREARIAWRNAAAMDGPLWVTIDCFESRPAGHFRTGQFAHLLRPAAPAHPDTTDTHDSGKLRRAVEDALTAAGVWADDKRVVDGHDRKHYCDPESQVLEAESWREPRALIRVGRMLHATVEEAGITSPPAAGQEQLIAA